MDLILQEIERALDARLYYLAVALALTVPDACSALQNPNGAQGRARYKSWFNAHLKTTFNLMTADDFWKFRCAVLHQGYFHHNYSGFKRVLIMIPQPGPRFHRTRMNDALALDADMFCREIITAAREWYERTKDDPAVVRHLPKMVQLRPSGLPPYVVGAPCIA